MPAHFGAVDPRHALMPFDKTRFRFRKDGDLRLVSHHDLMRAFERMLRRADLPFRSTEGFHPQPRMVFALSLPLGVIGRAEVIEIEWTEPIDSVHALNRLNERAPLGLTLVTAKPIELKQSARPSRAAYRLPIEPHDVSGVAVRCREATAATELWVDRERPRPRQINIRPYVKNLQCTEAHLEMDLWITQDGSARADEIVRLLELNHQLDRGAILERCALEIWDELDAAAVEPQPAFPTAEERSRMERPLTRSRLEPVPVGAHWSASPSGPIVE